MNPIFAAALDLQEFCLTQNWRFCFIGGLAVQRWGEPRLTRDADMTLLTGFGHEAEFADRLLARFAARLDEARELALTRRVLLLQSSAGVPLDIAFGALPFEEHTIERASRFALSPQASLQTCSAEDLITLKVFAGRERDWLDVHGIVLRQGPRLDEPLIWEELLPLLDLKEEPESADRLRGVLATSGGPSGP